jgi:transposase
MGSSKGKKGRAGLAVVESPKRSAEELGSGERSESGPSGGARSGARSLVTSAEAEALTGSAPDPEVAERPLRRQFSAQYKLRIVQEAGQCRDSNGIGSLLRREGLYSSHLSTWRRQYQEGSLNALAPRKRGPRAQPAHADTRRLAEAERKVKYLERRLKKAEALLDLQKKVAEILEIDLPPAPSDEGE